MAPIAEAKNAHTHQDRKGRRDHYRPCPSHCAAFWQGGGAGRSGRLARSQGRSFPTRLRSTLGTWGSGTRQCEHHTTIGASGTRLKRSGTGLDWVPAHRAAIGRWHFSGQPLLRGCLKTSVRSSTPHPKPSPTVGRGRKEGFETRSKTAAPGHGDTHNILCPRAPRVTTDCLSFQT